MTRENAMTKTRDDKGAETKANARATTRAVARTKASEPMSKSNEDEVAEAMNGHSTEVTEDAMAKTSNTEAAETREDAGMETEQDIRTESKEDDVAVNIYNFQKLSTEQLESNASASSSFLDTLQAIAAEASDYSRRSLENRSTFIAKLLGAKSFDSVIQIHSEYAKRSYESFVVQAKKMGKLYSDLAKEFFKPIQTFNANDARKSGL